ncbi:MAG: site-2 protease family protein [Clostridia bacterium]|nr:site-2 protease family protein [Clostridia bacterium]
MGLTLREMILRLPVLFIAISVHEYSHGYAAYKMGDGTAKMQGRLTLNPLAHIDILGALCMVLFGFGWAKAVPINPNNFRDRKKGLVLVSLAGPLSNFFIAIIGAVLYGIFARFNFGSFNIEFAEVFYGLMNQLILLNVCFGVFNLLPIPPLDGSKIVGAFLPYRIYYKVLEYERYAFPVLLILLYTNILSKVLFILINPVLKSINSLINFIVNI